MDNVFCLEHQTRSDETPGDDSLPRDQIQDHSMLKKPRESNTRPRTQNNKFISYILSEIMFYLILRKL